MGVLWLYEIDKDDIPIAGGKGANLGELMRLGIPVPEGFVVDANTFKNFIESTGLKEKIIEILNNIDVNNTKELEEASRTIRRMIEETPMPKEIEEEIRRAYRQLCEELGEEVYVAVRSSATAEDLPSASFAGQQETYLNVKGEDDVVEKVKKCWSSLYTPRAIFYRVQHGFRHETVSIAVVVQKMVNSEKSGVMFTSHPITGEKIAIIEAVFGLGEAIVSGAVTPDHYEYDRIQRKLINVQVAEKKFMLTRKDGETVKVELGEKGKERVLSDEEIEELVKLGEIIEDHYGHPQDVEWAIEKGKIYIVQSRPITTIRGKVEEREVEEGEILVKGLGASPGIGIGRVKIVLSPEDIEKVEEGDVLVTTMTTPDMVPAMRKASAIVTDEGGLTCLAKDTILLTDRGFMKAEEIYEMVRRGESIRLLSLDYSNLKPTWKRIVRAMKRKAEVVRVSISQTGRVDDNYLDVTPDHRFYVLKGRELTKKRLDEVLRDGNHCLVLSKVENFARISNPKLAYVLGLILSDGYIRLDMGVKKYRRGAIVFTQNGKEEIVSKFLEYFKDVFGDHQVLVKAKVSCGGIQGSANDYIISSLDVALQISQIVQNLEEFVLNLDEESLIAFVSGLIDGDGSVYGNRIQIYVSKENVFRGLVLALLSLGILPQVTRNRDILNVQITEDLEIFSEYSVKVRNSEIRERKRYGTKFLPARDLLSDIVDRVNWKGKIKPYVEKNLLIDKEKVRERILPLIDDEKLIKLLNSPIQSLRIRLIDSLGVQDVYNFEVDAEEEMEKNYIVFTSRLTPIVVSNCHAAIVSRELGVPAVVGTGNATKVLKDGMIVTVDGDKGIVYKGALKEKREEEKVIAVAPQIITATEVKVNISIPDVAERVAKETNADGVGLLRIEHMVLSLKKHPMKYIKDGEIDVYIDELYRGLKKVVKAFYPKPVWIRTLDAPTDEFRSMEGGEEEPIEANPMLGYRGIRRDLKEEIHFRAEMRAIKKLIDEGYTNVGIMLPLVTRVDEVKKAKKIAEEEGIPLDKIDFGIMVETPASALIIEDIIRECGITFVSFGTNDLTQYTLAVDRNNEHVAYLYDEKHPAVLKLIEHVINVCKKYGVKTSICGQAGSDPKFAEILVRMGIDSISANPDAVQRIREVVARIERKIMLEKLRNL